MWTSYPMSGSSILTTRTLGGGSAGLDAKVGLSSNFTLDATVNPDFGQVEADPSVVNLTAYETFYEEKRPFFLEGRKILTFGTLGSDQLFYSRRIGQAPSYNPPIEEGETGRFPESTTILTALKVTGKTSDSSARVSREMNRRLSVAVSSEGGMYAGTSVAVVVGVTIVCSSSGTDSGGSG